MVNGSGDVSWNSTGSDFSQYHQIIEVPDSVQEVLVILYSMTALLSTVGNLVVIVVFVISRQRKTALRTFLANLALSDLVMAVFCMPFTFSYTMLNRWVFGPFLCTLVLFMQSVAVIASVGTSTAIAVDRYMAVAYPLRRPKHPSLRNWLIVAAIWITAAAVSSPQLAVGKKLMAQSPEEVPVPECTEDWPEPKQTLRRLYTFFILATTYLLPLFVIGLAYGFVSRSLWKRQTPGNPDEIRDNNQLQSKRKVIKMLIIVVSLFGLCWFPLHLFTIVLDFNSQFRSEGKTSSDDTAAAIYIAVHWLAMSNSFVNPIVYSFLNDSFRGDLRWLLRRCRRCSKRGGDDDIGSRLGDELFVNSMYDQRRLSTFGTIISSRRPSRNLDACAKIGIQC